jgi:hypothetical protein
VLSALNEMRRNAQQALAYATQVPKWTADRMAVDAIAMKV